MIKSSLQRLDELLKASHLSDFSWKEHVFPRYSAPVLVQESGQRRIKPMSFALIPYWEKGPKPKMFFHNARSETVTEKPSFSRAFQKTRCLVPLDTFFEWVPGASGGKKQLLAFAAQGEQILCAAGIWSHWRPGAIDTFAIITREPSDFIKSKGHDRMPIFLPPELWDAWLDPRLEELAAIKSMIKSPMIPELSASPFSP